MRRAARWAIAVAAVPVAAVATLAVEVELARRGDRLPDAPLDLDVAVGGGGGRTLVSLGDSTAAGLGATEAGATVALRVAEALEGPVAVRSLAVSGARVADVAEEQLPQLRGERAELVLVSVGANDVTHLTPRDEFRRAYRKVLDGLPASADVVLLGVPDMGAIPRLAQPLRALAGWRGRMLDEDVRNLAVERGATYVDIAGQTGPAFRADPDRYFAADDYHPSDAGYRLWADAVIAAIDS